MDPVTHVTADGGEVDLAPTAMIAAVLAPSGPPRVLWVIATIAAAVLIAFTLKINVLINKRTLTWNPEHPRMDGGLTGIGGTPTRGCGHSWFLCAVGAVTLA